MPTCLVSDVFNDVRALLSDTQIVGGESFTNTYLLPLFGEPYRSMYSRMMGGSKRVQRVVGVVLPAQTNVLIPSTYNILDLSDPEMLEERSAPSAIALTGTDTSTPIVVTTASPLPGSPANGTILEGFVSGVSGTSAPWGNWFATVTGTSTFTLNGSASDGVSGTGGNFYLENNQQFTEVDPTDLTAGGLDGLPQSVLGVYLWQNEMFKFRGASQNVQLRITYYASGTAPTNVNYTIPVDNARDFLVHATAAKAAESKNWFTRADSLRKQAYGDPAFPDTPGLLDLFYLSQVMSSQRGPARRQLPFRDKRYKFGNCIIG